jgi:hypothetical protein
MNDIAAGTTALYSILGSYIKKLKTGEGIYLETSLLEAGLAWTFWEFGAYYGGGELPLASGTRHRRSTPYQAYKTQDGYVTVGGNNDKLWTNFCTQVLNKPELLKDARFNPLAARLKNIDALQDEIEKVFLTAPTCALGGETRRRLGARGPGIYVRPGARGSAHHRAQHGDRDRPSENRAHEKHGLAGQNQRRVHQDALAGAVARPAFG